jgi:hypothetical protein
MKCMHITTSNRYIHCMCYDQIKLLSDSVVYFDLVLVTGCDIRPRLVERSREVEMTVGMVT